MYSITSPGRRALKKWLNEPASAPSVRNELLLKFFLSSQLPATESIRLISEYKLQQKAALNEYQQSEKVLRQAIREGEYPDELNAIFELTSSTSQGRAKQCEMFYLTLRHGVRALEARIVWCDEVLKTLAK